MRIIIFGGFFDYQIQFANCLSQKNDVSLVFPTNSIEKDYSENINRKINLYLLGIGKSIYHPVSLLALNNFLKYIDKFDPDIIHIQLGYGIITPSIFAIMKFKKYPIVTTFHDVDAHIGENSWFKKFSRYFIRKYSNRIIVHGEILKDYMIQKYKLSEKKVLSIPIGIHEVQPFKKYEKKDLKEEENLILFFGRIYEYKGLAYLIRAEPLIKKDIPSIKIIIAGVGEDFKKYEDMMINKDSFIIKNYRISYKEGAELFQKSKLVVLPYIEASQSGVVCTAYGFKKPVVATNVGSIPEIVENGITGILVPPRDPIALAEAIIKLLKNDNLCTIMGNNAFAKLNTDLAWDKITEETIKVYEDINESIS